MSKLFFDKTLQLGGITLIKNPLFNTVGGASGVSAQYLRVLADPIGNNILFRTMKAKESEKGPRFTPESNEPLGLISNGTALQFDKDGSINYKKTCDRVYNHHRHQSFLSSFSFLPTIYSLISIATGKSQVKLLDHTAIHPTFKILPVEAMHNLSSPDLLGISEGRSATFSYEMEMPIQDPSHLTCIGNLQREGTSITLAPNPFYIDLNAPGLPEEIKTMTKRAAFAYTLANINLRDPDLAKTGKIPLVTIEDAQQLAIQAVTMYREYQLGTSIMNSKEKDEVANFLSKTRESKKPNAPETSRIEVIDQCKSKLDSVESQEEQPTSGPRL